MAESYSCVCVFRLLYCLDLCTPVLTVTAICSYAEDETITNIGALADRVYCLKEGKVHQYGRRNSDDSPRKEKEVAAAAFATGDAFAELAAIVPYAHKFTARCIEYSFVCELERRHILELASIKHDLAEALVVFAEENTSKMERLGVEDIEGNIASLKALKRSGLPNNVNAILGGGMRTGTGERT
jgi:CRP-like cAMP-binding protein